MSARLLAYLWTHGRAISAAARASVSQVWQRAKVLVNAAKSCAKFLHEVFTGWWLYKNTVATETNTAATAENTMAMTAEATEAGTTAAGKLSSMIQRAWAVVRKPFACVGSAYAGYLIYSLLFHEQSGLVDTILKGLTIGLGVYTGVAVIGAVATGLWVAGGAATGWCIDKYHGQAPASSRRSRTGIKLNIHLHKHRHVHYYRL